MVRYATKGGAASVRRFRATWLGTLVSFLLCVGAVAQETVDLAQGQEDVRITGAAQGDRAGTAVASGDLNGDGFDDLIIGAPNVDPGNRAVAGAVYVLFGQVTPSAQTSLSTTYDLVIYGESSGDRLGSSLTSADVNGDGYDDLVLGAPSASHGGIGDAGKTYVIYGGPSLPASIDLSQGTGDVALQIWGGGISHFLGEAIDHGDFNGDGYEDLAVSAIGASLGARVRCGITYIVLGEGGAFSDTLIDLSSGDSTNVMIAGKVDNVNSGNSIASGDIDADGYDDIMVASVSAATNGTGSGEVYVKYGSSALPAVVDLLTDADLTVIGEAGSYLGYGVGSGDIDRDGYGDLVVGAPGASGFNGQTYVLFGKDRSLLPAQVDLSVDTADMTIDGEAVSLSGLSLAVANLNGDGFDDILTSGSGASAPAGASAGVVYALLGDQKEALSAAIDLAITNADVEVFGAASGDQIGVPVVAGDLNGDGIEDMIIGSIYPDNFTGCVYVVWGEPPYLEVSVQTGSATYYQPLNLSVTIDSTSGMKIVDATAAVSFNRDLLTFTGLTPGPLTPSWSLGYTIKTGTSNMDTLLLDLSGDSFSGIGTFLGVDFWVNKLREAITSPVTLESLSFNGGRSDWYQVEPGLVTLTGTNGALESSIVSEPGDTLAVRVTDVDLSIDIDSVETWTAVITNPGTGEQETIVLTEQGLDDSVYFGQLVTALGDSAGVDEDGLMLAQAETQLLVTYPDPLSSIGPPNAIVDTHLVVVLGDVDSSSVLQAYDAALILSRSAGSFVLTGRDSLVANLDAGAPHSSITAFDAALAIQRRLGLISRFPVQATTSSNHPQPGASGGGGAKAVVEERSVRVQAQEEGFLSVQIDERSDIIAADLVIEGVSGQVEMGTGMERFMIAVYEAKDGLHVSFAGPKALTGPGELFRIYPSESAGEVGLLRGHFNGGRIGVRLERRLIPAVTLPQQFALHANAPNPFNAETLIRFDLPTEARVSIEVYNVLGQKVRTLLQERRAAGRYQIGWDSRDDAGRALASGVYFYRLIAEEFVQTRRMMLAK